MIQKIGTEQDLVERIGSSKGILLVRAINDNELDQLLREGSESFCFNRRTEYETEYGDMVKMFAERRNGTVIVYQLQRGDTGTIFDENRRFDINGWGYCVKGFNAPVEVYNVKGSGLEELRQLRERGTIFDQIARKIFAEGYAKSKTSARFLLISQIADLDYCEPTKIGLKSRLNNP